MSPWFRVWATYIPDLKVIFSDFDLNTNFKVVKKFYEQTLWGTNLEAYKIFMDIHASVKIMTKKLCLSVKIRAMFYISLVDLSINRTHVNSHYVFLGAHA